MLLLSTNKLIAIVGCPFMLNMAINAYFYKEYVRTITELQATISKILDVQDKLLQRILEQESIISKNADIFLKPNPVVDTSNTWAVVGEWAVPVILCIGIVGLSCWAGYAYIGGAASSVAAASSAAAPAVSSTGMGLAYTVKLCVITDTLDTLSAQLELISQSSTLLGTKVAEIEFKIAEILARLPAENNMPVVEAPADAVLETVTHIVDTVVTRGLS